MKIAIQLAANPRSFKRNYEHFLKNLVEPLNPDVFIHTWDLEGNDRPEVTTDGSCQEYIDLYQPLAHQIEHLVYNYEPLKTMRPHFTSRHRVNELRRKYELDNNIEYDVVIMARPDVKLINPVPNGNSACLGSEFKPEYLDHLEANDIWIHHFKEGLPSDYFWYASPKMMNLSIDGCFNNLDKLHIYTPGAERLWWHILQEAGFSKNEFKYYGNSIHDKDAVDNSFRFFDIECVR
jgi:hypothetical protein